MAHHKKAQGSYSIDILDSMGKTLNKSDFEYFYTKMWGVWKDRCTLAHNLKALARPKDTPQMGQWTDRFLYDFEKAQKHSSPSGGSLVARYSPIQDCATDTLFSIFVDAAFSDATLTYATAFAIFDTRENIWAAGYHQIQPPGAIMAAELQAIADEISYGKRSVPGRFNILSDSVEAIHSVLSNAPYKGIEELLISDIKNHINDS